MKKCNTCNTVLPETRFEVSIYKGLKTRRKKCKLCRNEERKRYESRHGEGLRWRYLQRQYGLTFEQYQNKSELQGHKCKICDKVNTFGPHKLDKLVVDHCHKTGKLRDLLCDKCNKGLGQFDDNPELLTKAINYLLNHNEVL